MRVMSIASGSSGNSYYIGNSDTSILLDAGISMKRIEEGLKKADVKLSEVNALLITHEHIDHIKSLGVISRKYHLPVYATYGTIDGIMTTSSLGTFDYNLLKPIKNDSDFYIGDIRVNTHSISHDANDPVSYTFENNGKKAAFATDLGIYDDFLVDFLSESEYMLIEANHDVRMLEVGPYPYPLKQRIKGDRGHLSNEAGGSLIKRLLHEKVKCISLGHLSDKNNYPALAFETVKQIIQDNAFTSDVRDFNLGVAPRSECSDIVEL